MIKNIKIAEERIPVLIGKHGNVKKEIEEYTKTSIAIGDAVAIEGEALDVMTAENVIRAIGRGFAPEKALELVDEENTIIVIALEPNSAGRIKSRVIGTRGKTRFMIEKYTRTYISVYGKTISIIGNYEDAELARQAIEKFIEGSPHKNVYMFLEKNCKK